MTGTGTPDPARLVFPGLRWEGRSPESIRAEVRAALDLGVGGFVVFGGSMDSMRALAARALRHAGRPVLFASDLERGAGQQLAGATPLPPAAAIGALGPEVAAEAAGLTAREAAAAGIGWVLAPVADLDIEPANPIIGTRSFGPDPAAASDCVAAWVRGAQAEGVHACVKHFPGHGRTTTDSHAGLPVVDASATALEADLAPFRAGIGADATAVMMAHVRYPALDPSGAAASLSPAVVELLRARLGFDGIVATDALIMDAIGEAAPTERRAAIDAVAAGLDAILYPEDVPGVIEALRAASRSGELARDRVERAVGRIESAAASARLVLETPAPAPRRERALELAMRSLHPIRGEWPRWRPGDRVRAAILDDDADMPSGRFAVPTAQRAARGRFLAALEDRGFEIERRERDSGGAGAGPVDLVALFSDVRAWKGRAGLSETTRRELERRIDPGGATTVLLFGHPRRAAEVPAAAAVICAWSGEPLMMDAAAARLPGGA